MIPLVITEEVREQLEAVVELAKANPVDMQSLMARINTPDGKAHHMAQMTRQTITIPMDYMVTFSIEHGHPCGPCRHMSMSVGQTGRVPNPTAFWMIAQELGFWGTIEDCNMIWEEPLKGHGQAINAVQTLTKP